MDWTNSHKMQSPTPITIQATRESAETSPPSSFAFIGPVELLIFQPTPFCNIDCRYCYLPNRSSTRSIKLETVLEVANKVAAEGLLSDSISIVWHAGEPLMLPPQFYENAIRGIRERIPSTTAIRHTVQTNGTLLTEQWCDLFATNGVRVGLSLDGPATIHDAARVTRTGKGTFAQVIHGLYLLQERNIPHYILAVLTATSLKYPREMFDFLRSHNLREVGFNVEEIEGVHRESSLGRTHAEAFRTFMSVLYDMCAADPLAPCIREFRQLEDSLLHAKLAGGRPLQQLTPYRILSIDCEGGFSTLSPELVGMNGPPAGDYKIGNIHSDGLRDALTTPKFLSIYSSVMQGVEMCRRACEYFTVCGGGSPSNKLSEHGTFASTETLQCFLRVKQLSEVVLSKLEQRFGVQ